MAVLPLLHLVAGADPAAQLGLRLGIGVEVARAEGPPDQLDVAREALHHGLGDAHVRVQGGAGLLRVLARVVPHLVDVGLRGLDRLRLAHPWAFASASSIFAGLKPVSRVSPMMMHRQRHETDRHQLLASLRILPHVLLHEWHSLLRQILCRAMTGASADIRVDGHVRHVVLALLDRVCALATTPPICTGRDVRSSPGRDRRLAGVSAIRR